MAFKLSTLTTLTKRQLIIFVWHYLKLCGKPRTGVVLYAQHLKLLDNYIVGNIRPAKIKEELLHLERPTTSNLIEANYLVRTALDTVINPNYYTSYHLAVVLHRSRVITPMGAILNDMMPPVKLTIPKTIITNQMKGLCKEINETNNYSTLPILADMLLDSGYDNVYVQAHCRKKKFHRKGCWVIHKCLGRS